MFFLGRIVVVTIFTLRCMSRTLMLYACSLYILIVLSCTEVQAFNIAPQDALKPVFNSLWKADSWLRSLSYDDHGVRGYSAW